MWNSLPNVSTETTTVFLITRATTGNSRTPKPVTINPTPIKSRAVGQCSVKIKKPDMIATTPPAKILITVATIAKIKLIMTAPNEKMSAMAVASNGNERGADSIARIMSQIADIFFFVDFAEEVSKSFNAKSANICEATCEGEPSCEIT